MPGSRWTQQAAEKPKVGFRDVGNSGRCSEWKAKLGDQFGIVLFAGLQAAFRVLLSGAHELIAWFQKQHRRATLNHPKQGLILQI